MKIAIFNGSPRKENTAAMVDAFAGEENKAEDKLAEIRAFAKNI